jgi:uncharacterized phiE125 gp8 family phage protein
MMVTTLRPTPPSLGGAPPTIAVAGVIASKAARLIAVRTIAATQARFAPPCQHDPHEDIMAAILLTPPAIEPLSLADAKTFLRVEHDDDDAVIAGLIAAARGQIEALTRRALIVQSWRVTLDRWPRDRRLSLRIAPLRAVLAARLFDAQGSAQPLDAASFGIDAAASIVLAPPGLPRPGRAAGGIALDLELGFGPAAEDVPELLRHALRTLVAHWYDNRGLAAIGQSVALLPGSVAAMIASYRVLSL